jgi:hypothetical protein
MEAELPVILYAYQFNENYKAVTMVCENRYQSYGFDASAATGLC